MVIFEQITWRNLLSTGAVPTTIDFRRNSTTLITGKNGHGKSTLLDAVCFVLFNRPYRNINKNQLINTINKRDLFVELSFSIGSNRYIVRRGMKPNLFEIIQNDVKLEQDAAIRDFQNYLETRILQLNYRAFTQLVIIGSASYVPFMQLSAAHRREVIEDLLDIRVFTTMNSLLKEKIQANRDAIIAEENRLASARDVLNVYLKSQIESDQSVQSRIEEIDEQIQVARQSIAAIKREATELVAEIESADQISKRSNEIRENIRILEQTKSQIEDRRRRLAKTSAFYHTNSSCPSCSQEIDEKFKNDKLCMIDQKLALADDHIGKVVDKITALRDELVAIDVELTRCHQLKSKLVDLRIDLAKYESVVSSLIESKNTTMAGTSVDHKEAIKQTRRQIKQSENALVSLKKQRQMIDVAGELLRDRGIKSKIIKQYIPLINKTINRYLADMGFVVHFELDENFNETIKARHRDDFTYASFSEGEKARLDAAIMFTWRAIAKIKNTMHTNLLILDETFDASADADAAEAFIKLIRDECANDNVFVISHRMELVDSFHGLIQFEKVKGFSRMGSTQ